MPPSSRNPSSGMGGQQARGQGDCSGPPVPADAARGHISLSRRVTCARLVARPGASRVRLVPGAAVDGGQSHESPVGLDGVTSGGAPMTADNARSRLRSDTVPAAQEREPSQDRERYKREMLNALVGEQVLHALGEPSDLLRVQVRPLWEDTYRVNVFVGVNAASARVANSYFVGERSRGPGRFSRGGVERKAWRKQPLLPVRNASVCKRNWSNSALSSSSNARN